MDEQPQDNKIRFDKTINLGHVLTMAAFIVAMLVSWNVMDKRVLVLEEFRSAQHDRDAQQDVASKEKFQEVKDALIDLRRGVERVADKVGAR